MEGEVFRNRFVRRDRLDSPLSCTFLTFMVSGTAAENHLRPATKEGMRRETTDENILLVGSLLSYDIEGSAAKVIHSSRNRHR